MKLPTAFVINLARSSGRWAQFNVLNANVFDDVQRINGVDGSKLPLEHVRAYATAANESVWRVARDNNITVKYPGRATADGLRTTYAPEKIKFGSRAFYHVSGMCGLYTSHLLALRVGLESALPRFCIVEDDAAFRCIDVPLAPAADILLYGSCPMGSFKADETRSKKRALWTRPRNRYDTLLATATEYTRHGARVVLDYMSHTPGQWDTFWWEALKQCNTWQLTPMLFTQVGSSTYKGGGTR